MELTMREHVYALFVGYLRVVITVVSFYVCLPIIALLGFYVFMSLATIVVFVLSIFSKIAWYINHIFNLVF